MNPNADGQVVAVLVIAVILAFVFYRRRWRGSGTAFGTANWTSDKDLRKAGMLGQHGLILGRTFGGALIRLPDYCHVLVCGGTGSGKGVSIIIPNLLTHSRGSIVCFDTKGDLYETTAKRRAARGERIIRLAPFGGGEDAFNPLGRRDCRPPRYLLFGDGACCQYPEVIGRWLEGVFDRDVEKAAFRNLLREDCSTRKEVETKDRGIER